MGHAHSTWPLSLTVAPSVLASFKVSKADSNNILDWLKYRRRRLLFRDLSLTTWRTFLIYSVVRGRHALIYSLHGQGISSLALASKANLTLTILIITHGGDSILGPY